MRSRGFFHISYVLIFCFIVCSPGSSYAKTEIIKIKNREASSIISMVEQILTKDGKVIADKIINAIIITDTPEVCEEAIRLIANLDIPSPQVRIKVRLTEDARVQSRGVSVAGPERSRRSVGVTLHDGSRKSGYFSETMISVLSGSHGYISVSERVPYLERWIILSRRYAHISDSIRFLRLNTGMEVRPTAIGNKILIEIIPRITYWAHSDSGVIRFAKASTTLTVPRGEWISLGGSDAKSNEVIREILTRASSQSNIGLRLSLKADF
ncbi:secretin N-terminal domain-containing protein [Thermodesulfobacteriota bacterium]